MSKTPDHHIIGGGTKKILYTLSTLKRMGLKQSAKALKSNNACKACGLGMGGQQGGMTNELGEFPAVCNKSIQAQSTDIQQPIPSELFERHTLDDFKELSGYEIEHLGRLASPIYKTKTERHYQKISWDDAIQLVANQLKKIPATKSFFYSSGRSSNEAGFILQLLSRLYGTNNVNNCSYYCHQATGVALSNTIGTGTSTVELSDLSACDVIFVIGANPASNHPRFIHQLKALRDRGGSVIVINPAKEPGLVKFAVPKSAKSMLLGGTDIATEYCQPNIGTDLVLLKGLAKAIIELKAEDNTYIQKYTQGYDSFLNELNNTDWQTIVQTCGISKEQIQRIAQCYAQSSATVFAWGMGITHHQQGVDTVEVIVNLALLRGMVGKAYAGLLPLRGHSNVQGIGTIGVKPVLPQDVFQRIEALYGIQLPTEKGMDTLACLEAAHHGNIDFALMMGGNLFAASPHREWTMKALDNIGFKVFLTTTLNHGHVFGHDHSESLVLPVTARDEEWEPTTQESMFNFLRLSDGGITRLENVRPETVVLTQIAEKVWPHSPINFSQLRQHKKIREAIAATIPGLEQLKEIDTTKKEFHISNRLIKTPIFHTQNGYAQFTSKPMQSFSQIEAYPFKLMTVRSEGQFNTIIYEEKDSYRQTPHRWCVLMNLKTIQELNLKQHSLVTLKSAYGIMKNVEVFPFDLPDYNLMAYFPEANRLIGLERDERSKTPAFKSVDVVVL